MIQQKGKAPGAKDNIDIPYSLAVDLELESI